MEAVKWIHKAQDGDQWRSLVKTLRNLIFHEEGGNSYPIQRVINYSITLSHGANYD